VGRRKRLAENKESSDKLFVLSKTCVKPMVRLRSLCAVALLVFCARSFADPGHASAVIQEYCFDCHDTLDQKGDLDLETLLQQKFTANSDTWEKVVRKLDARHMPPVGKPRPDEPTFNATVAELAATLDKAAAQHPNPGRTETLRRLNRTEFQNAIRDLLGLQIDATALLPKDESSHGFDNITVGALTPTFMERYVSAAEKISQLAVGVSRNKPDGETYRVPADVTQESRVDGLPLGTRGGLLISEVFPQNAEYDFQMRLTRDRNEEIEGLNGIYEMELLIDGSRVERFTVAPPKVSRDFDSVDRKLKARVPVSAGLHHVGVTFVDNSSSLLERKRQPYSVAFNMHRHPRLSPAIYQVSITGPYNATGPGDTASRRKIFIVKPANESQEESCAEKIFSNLARRAYRRPVTSEDLLRPMTFYRQAREHDNFEAGIEAGLSAILVSPQFLFHIEEDPEGVPPNTAYRISDLQLASRLSFFLWSSIPDEELLRTAISGELHQPKILAREMRRMLADGRAHNLVSNFAGQWLYLRNIESLTPDARLFPDFDENLRQDFRRETELFVASVFEENRSVLDLLKSDYTFLNERLAKHYGIDGVYGSHFRKVKLQPKDHRGGLLRQGSILAVTSYATRTSPVVRGHWILANLLGTPPPPQPANVPALKENTISSMLSVRDRLAQHRANPACASCHKLMDPVGFSLENFDAVGRWRDFEADEPVDASGGLPDGSTFVGVEGLEKNLLKRPELFVGAFAEKLLTFALGRGIEPYDGPAVRKIVREAKENDYHFSSIVLAVVNSTPFTMRKSSP
jgi:hypothetical protein